MNVIPASSAAWIVAIDRLRSSGLPSMDIGMPPSPIALTVVLPIRRVFMGEPCPALPRATPGRAGQDAPVSDVAVIEAADLVAALRAAGLERGEPVALVAVRGGG